MKSSSLLAAVSTLLLLLESVHAQQPCADDPTGELQAAIQLDCTAAIAQTGGSCDFSLAVWFHRAATLAEICPVSCGTCGGTPSPPSPAATGGGCSPADVAESAQAITAVCCAGTKCTAAHPIPGSCSGPCAVLLAPLARRCGDFLAENIPALTPLTQLCLERDGGIAAGSGTIEPSGEIAWPPCDHDDADFGTSACEASIASGLSCGSMFCPECGGLARKCDATCGFPCPTEGVQFPPDQPFLLCFEATCGSPPVDQRGGQVCEIRLSSTPCLCCWRSNGVLL